MKQAIQKLEIALEHFHTTSGDVEHRALLARDELVVCMNSLRHIVDIIETKVDANIWPIPSYMDLLFGI